jgi:hypothetical protein
VKLTRGAFAPKASDFKLRALARNRITLVKQIRFILSLAVLIFILAVTAWRPQATQQLMEAWRGDPKAQLWPEVIVDIIGGDYLRAGDAKTAIELFKLNLLAKTRHSLATLFSVARRTIGSAGRQDVSSSNDFWRCPRCGGPMVVVERLTAAEIQLRSPPLTAAA